MRYYSLYAFYFIYFIMNGASAFIPKYYGEIGLSDGQIGLLSSVPTLAALVFMPALGALSDRVPRKRYLLSVLLLVMALACFSVVFCSNFLMLLVAVSAYMTFYVSASPVSTTISLEYCAQINRPYGPIRLMGTLGYQAGALLVGILLSKSLGNLYPLMGAAVLAACAITFLMPNIEGHQHHRKKVPLRRLFADSHIRWLCLMILFASVTSQFYNAFFAKHLGDLGMSNAVVSWITLLSVLPELPFLFFGDRIAQRTSIWNWLLVGFAVNGVRWLGLAFSTSVAPIIAFQLLGVTVLGCFEFMPAFYLNRRVPAELAGSAQSMLSLTVFGAGKVLGGLLGGLICECTSIPTGFAINGVLLLAGCAAFWKTTRRLIREETV